jgi:CBS domain-containing protein
MPSVKDIMTKEVVKISVNDDVFVAAELMNSSEIGCLVVVDGENPIGIITERDIVRRVVAKELPLETKVSKVMSKSLITIDPEASLKEAARVMSSHKIRRLPVLKQNKLVGIIVSADFVRNVGKKSVSEEILEAMGRARGRYPDASFP